MPPADGTGACSGSVLHADPGPPGLILEFKQAQTSPWSPEKPSSASVRVAGAEYFRVTRAGGEEVGFLVKSKRLGLCTAGVCRRAFFFGGDLERLERPRQGRVLASPFPFFCPALHRESGRR